MFTPPHDFPIPVIDLSDEASTHAVAEACQEIGCFYISGHGLAGDFLNDFRRVTKSYFDLPLSDKMALHISKSRVHRGYFSIGEETAKNSAIGDLKEGFDMALDLPADDPDVLANVPLHGPNVYPTLPPAFAEVVKRYYAEVRCVAERLAVLFGAALALPDPAFFLAQSLKPLAQLRVLHYPPQVEIPADLNLHSIGAGTHTDYGIVTVLWQDEVGGLEVMIRDGSWISAPAIPGTFFCNIGDMMERWTNGLWVATRHRVINRAKVDRYSAAFFFDPNYASLISPLSQFVNSDRPPKFPPVTMGEYLRSGFDGTFAYRGHPAILS